MKINEVGRILQRTDGSAIVYVRSRKRTREISEHLESLGITSTYYHAGLDFETKEERLEEWQDQGDGGHKCIRYGNRQAGCACRDSL